MAKYVVENQWGGTHAPWFPAGEWVLGNRDGQNLIRIDVSSNDGGKTLIGYVIYENESHKDFKATWISDNSYEAYTRKSYFSDGEYHVIWEPEGTFVIGHRENQRVVMLRLNSNDGGDTFFESKGVTYDREDSPLGFNATIKKQEE